LYIVAAFEHSTYLELALAELERKGIAREKILAVPLDQKLEERKALDSIHRSDGFSLLDGSAIMGTVFMLLGTIYGFVLKWGPVLWALIGFFFGAFLGFALDFFVGRNPRGKRKNKKRATEVVLIINCGADKTEIAESILQKNFAIGVGRLVR